MEMRHLRNVIPVVIDAPADNQQVFCFAVLEGFFANSMILAPQLHDLGAMLLRL